MRSLSATVQQVVAYWADASTNHVRSINRLHGSTSPAAAAAASAVRNDEGAD